MHLVKRDFFQTDQNGYKLNFTGQLFSTTEEDAYAVNEGFSSS